MTRVPSVGGDNGSWGDVLNAYLATGHTSTGRNKNAYDGVFNVLDYGAVGDGVTDDTAAILEAISDATNGGAAISPLGSERRGIVYFPFLGIGTGYLMSQTIPLCDGLKMSGPPAFAKAFRIAPIIINNTTDVFTATTGVNEGYIGNLSFYSNQTTHDIFASMASDASGGVLRYWKIENCDFSQGFRAFMSQAVILGTYIRDCNISPAGNGSTIPIHILGSDWWMTGCNVGVSSLAASAANFVVQLDTCAYFWFKDNFINPPTTQNPTVGSLNVRACHDGVISDNQMNIDLATSAVTWGAQCKIDTGSYNLVVRGNNANRALSNGGSNSSGYYTVIDSSNILLDGNVVDGTGGGNNFAGYYVTVSGGATDNVRIKNPIFRALSPAKFLVQGASTNVVVDTDLENKALAVSGGTAQTLDCTKADNFQLTVSDGTAFTINAPSYPYKGKRITVDVKNASGGAMGAITWNAVFKLAGAFTNPATGSRRTITFYYDGTNWVETNRAAADI